jgi:4-hydroxybenzoate polyprenyltransferase
MSSGPRGVGRAPGREDYRYLNAARRLGYRLLPGDTFSYLLHLRPREWLIMAAHTSLGWILAVSSDPTAVADSLPRFAATLFVWVLLLNGGTLALNSAFDADEGDIGYLDSPPPAPRFLAHFSLLLMLVGGVISLFLSRELAVVYGICFTLSILYSVPPFRLKAIAGMDWVVNFAGFGALTPLAGWLASARPLTQGALLVLAGFAILFAAFYPLTQIYQMDEDRARGDHTLAIALGAGRSLALALLLVCGAFALLSAGVFVLRGEVVSLLLLSAALLSWCIVLHDWIRRRKAMSTIDHKNAMYRSLGAWALTDVMVVLAVLA